MRRLLTTSLIALGLLGLSVPVAHADSAGCVTKKEYRNVEKSDSIQRVHRVFDTDGKRTSSGFGGQSRDYKPCSDPKYGFVTVGYDRRDGDWKLDSKYAYWGS